MKKILLKFASRSHNDILRAMPVKPRDPDAELAELAALIEGGDTSEAALERIAKLMGQARPDKNNF